MSAPYTHKELLKDPEYCHELIKELQDTQEYFIQKITVLEKVAAAARHALAIGYFNPGGSTEGSMREALAELDSLEGEK